MATVKEAIRRTRGVRGPAGSAPGMMGSNQIEPAPFSLAATAFPCVELLIHQKRMLARANYHRTGVVTQVSLWYGSGIAS